MAESEVDEDSQEEGPKPRKSASAPAKRKVLSYCKCFGA